MQPIGVLLKKKKRPNRFLFVFLNERRSNIGFSSLFHVSFSLFFFFP